MMIARDATEPMKTSHILGHRLRATHLRMILEHIPPAGRINVRVSANMFDHSVNPLGRQFDIVVQESNISAGRLTQTRVHRADHAYTFCFDSSERQLTLKAL